MPREMIDHIGGWLQHNLIVFIAVVLLPLKWIVVRLCKDPEAEAAALLSVPEDLCYVVLGLVLGDMTSSTGAFRHHFVKSDHVTIDLAVTVSFGITVALTVHRVAQRGVRHFQSWRAAGQSRTVDPLSGQSQQMELPITPLDANLTMIMLRHLLMFSGSYAIQLIVVLIWLHWVATVIAAA
jgi:hypothetical protein